MKIKALLLSLLVIAIDQVQKWHMLEVIDIANRPPIEVTPFFNLVMVWNYGISFGMFSGHAGEGAIWLIALALAIVGIMLVWLFRNDDKLVAYAIGMVVGGALGNVIDRVRFGAVADFFDVHAMGYHWPAFNIADSAIFIGVMLLLYDAMFRQHKGADETPS